MGFADGNCKGMELVEELSVVFGWVGRKGAPGEVGEGLVWNGAARRG